MSMFTLLTWVIMSLCHSSRLCRYVPYVNQVGANVLETLLESCFREPIFLPLLNNRVFLSRNHRLIGGCPAEVWCVRHLVSYCTRCKLRKKLQTCDTPSATWKVFYSSSLRCKLQEKLLRVTWPLKSNVKFEKENKRKLTIPIVYLNKPA